MELKIEERRIRVQEYQELRESTNWNQHSDSKVEHALKNDLFSICVLDAERVIGIGRVIGDGAIYFYIQDVIVLPDYQKRGIGKIIMKHIEAYLKKNTGDNAFIGLMAAEGVADFYKKFDYRKREVEQPGMFKVIKKS